MKRAYAVLKRALRPGMVPALLLVVSSIVSLAYIFLNGLDSTPLAYAVYVLSAYTIAVVAANLPGIVNDAKAFLYRHERSRRYFTDIPYRVRVSLYMSLGVNLAFALFKLVCGFIYSSFWFGAVAVYYIILSVTRFLMLRHMRSGGGDKRLEYRLYRLCGCLLFVLNLALAGVIYQMINSGKGYYYPGTLIYAAAAYAFYSLTTSLAGVVRFRKLHSPALSAAKILGVSNGLVSMFTLQTAMFASFGGEAAFQQEMNIATGGVVCLTVFVMAAFMVREAGKKLKEPEINTLET